MTLQLEIPDDVYSSLDACPGETERTALEAIAIKGYRSEQLSESQVRRLLGFGTRYQVHGFLKANRVPLNYSIEDLHAEVASLSRGRE